MRQLGYLVRDRNHYIMYATSDLLIRGGGARLRYGEAIRSNDKTSDPT